MRAKYIALMRTADRVDAAREHIVMRAGDYTVLRHEGGRYAVWGPDASGRQSLLSVHAKKSDAGMAATLNHEMGVA